MADEETVDPKKLLEESCKGRCVKPLFAYRECVKRVEKDETGHKHCTGQYFDYWSCVDKCAIKYLLNSTEERIEEHFRVTASMPFMVHYPTHNLPDARPLVLSSAFLDQKQVLLDYERSLAATPNLARRHRKGGMPSIRSGAAIGNLCSDQGDSNLMASPNMLPTSNMDEISKKTIMGCLFRFHYKHNFPFSALFLTLVFICHLSRVSLKTIVGLTLPNVEESASFILTWDLRESP